MAFRREANAEAARRKVLAVEIPRDELALRIGIACTGCRPPADMPAGDALDEFDRISAGDPRAAPMGTQFRAAADAAVLYLRECINAGKVPH